MFTSIGIIVVCLIVLVYVVAREPTWATVPFWQCHLSQDPEYVLTFSDGTFDEAARLAYKRSLDSFQNPNTPINDVLEDGVRVQRIAHRYMTPEQFEVHQPEVDNILNQTKNILNDDYDYYDADDNEDIEFRISIMNSLENVVDQIIPVRENITKIATKVAKKQNSKAEQSDTFIALSKKITDDPESVHDSTAIKCNKAIVQRIKTDTGGYKMSDIEEYFRKNMEELTKDPHGGKPRPKMLDKVLKVLHEQDSEIIPLGDTLHNIILYVWVRIHHPENSKNVDKMRQTMFDQFYDCYKLGLGGEQQRCSQGIATNILGALSPLDFDDANSHVLLRESIRNEIYEKIKSAVEDMATKEASSDNSNRAAVARSYLGELTDLDTDAEAAYEQDLRERLYRIINEETTRHNKMVPESAPNYFREMLINEVDQMY